MLAAFSEPLPEEGIDPAAVVRDLAERAGPGLMASGSGRFLGWVIGGALPAGSAADWLVSASTRTRPCRSPSGDHDDRAGGLGLAPRPAGPPAGGVGGLRDGRPDGQHGLPGRGARPRAGRPRVGRRAGRAAGCAPRQRARGRAASRLDRRVLRALGLGGVHRAGRRRRRGRPDAAGRPRRDRGTGERADGCVCTQAGNVNGGGVNPVGEITKAVRREDLWVHVNGAFGLWARAAPAYRHLAAGARDNSWATDAHKWLNTPYDCGMAICAHPAAHRRAMGVRAAYLPEGDDAGLRDPIDYNPELSTACPGRCRSGRVIPPARARRGGRPGGALLPDGRAVRRPPVRGRRRRGAAAEPQPGGGRSLDPAGGDHDAHSRAVVARAQAEGTCYPSGTVWRGLGGMRLSVSSWRTGPEDVNRSVAALLATIAGDAAADIRRLTGAVQAERRRMR